MVKLNQKGSAMMLTMCMIVILTSLAVVIVSVSAANISMGSRYAGWTQAYYRLDYATQEKLDQLDAEAFAASEKQARYYMQNILYARETLPAGTVYGGADLSIAIDSSLQRLICSQYAEINRLLHSGDQPESGGAPEASGLYPEEEYSKQLAQYLVDCFTAVYLQMLDNNLSGLLGQSQAENGVSVTVRYAENADWLPRYAVYATAGEFAEAAKTARLEITALDGDRQVSAVIETATPVYLSVPQEKYVAVKANPLYTNAISAAGVVRFEGPEIAVMGDVVASGGGDGVYAAANSSAAIYGNVYTNGGVHAGGDNSSIYILRYQATAPELKSLIYADGGYYLNLEDFSSSAFAADRYAEGSGEGFPFVFRDDLGGNVYCLDLSIDYPEVSARPDRLTGAILYAEGSVMTQGGVYNNGGAGTGVTILGNYVGMSSRSGSGSAVVNRAAEYGGYIRLEGDYVIPGLASYVISDSVGFYRTAESATAQNSGFLSIYRQPSQQPEESDDGEPQPSPDQIPEGYRAYTVGDEEYILADTGAIEFGGMAAAFAGAIREKIEAGGLESGITAIRSTKGYTLGWVVAMDEGGSFMHITDAAKLDYAAVGGGFLDRLFLAKATGYGTETHNMQALVDPSHANSDDTKGFYYRSGDFELTGSLSGILYVDGDLTIASGTTFIGSIICTGDITIRGYARLFYDDAAVKAVLLGGGSGEIERTDGSRAARLFFSPGGMGQTLAMEKLLTYSGNSGARMDSEPGYKVISWKESLAG